MRRMDRYQETSDEPKLTRSNQNQELYDSIGSNTRYTNFSDVTNANAIDISGEKNYKTREGYHQLKEYKEVIPTPRVKKELEEFKSLYQDKENKVYDINNVLEEARKNRLEKDALEDKRNLKNTSYNILTSLNPEELEKFRQEKKEKVIHPSDDELRELIDTITSKTLAGDIKAASSLLSDLMATSIMEQIGREEDDAEDEDEVKEETISDEKIKIEDIKKLAEATEEDDDEEIRIVEVKKETKKKEPPAKMEDKDEEFYTRSMDLSDQDFDYDDEFKDQKMPVAIKILITLIILVVIFAIGYFIWKNK